MELRPLGLQAALDAFDRSQSQTDEKRRAIELAAQRFREAISAIGRPFSTARTTHQVRSVETFNQT